MSWARGSLSLAQYRRASTLTRDLTAFGSFRELLTARSMSPGGYRPTLYTQPHPVRPSCARRRYTPEQQQQMEQRLAAARELADLYDLAQQQRGDARRAVRL